MPSRSGVPMTNGGTAPAPPAPPPSPYAPGGYSTYNPKPGEDPDWDAYVATYTARLKNAQAEADFAKAKLQGEYDRTQAKLDQELPGARTNLEAALLTRGVGRSGEAMNRRTGLESDMLERRSTAQRALLEGTLGVDKDLTAQQTEWAAEREGQIGASRERLKKRDITVAPDTPGYTPPAASTSSTKKKSTKKSTRRTLPPTDTTKVDYRGYANQWV